MRSISTFVYERPPIYLIFLSTVTPAALAASAHFYHYYYYNHYLNYYNYCQCFYSVVRSVCHNFLIWKEVTLPRFYRSTCYNQVDYEATERIFTKFRDRFLVYCTVFCEQSVSSVGGHSVHQRTVCRFEQNFNISLIKTSRLIGA